MMSDSDRTEQDGPCRRTRTRSSFYKANDEGGYANPPVSGQFGKGSRGGPGRPRGITNLNAAIRKALGKKLSVTKDGRLVKMTPWEVYAERVLEAILSKTTSPALLEFGHDLLTRFEVSEPTREPDYSLFSVTELKLFGALMYRALREPAAEVPDMFGNPVEGLYRVERGDDGHVYVERVAETELKLLTPPCS